MEWRRCDGVLLLIHYWNKHSKESLTEGISKLKESLPEVFPIDDEFCVSTKVKAIYAFLGIRTSVMNVHDFLKSNIV